MKAMPFIEGNRSPWGRAFLMTDDPWEALKLAVVMQAVKDADDPKLYNEFRSKPRAYQEAKRREIRQEAESFVGDIASAIVDEAAPTARGSLKARRWDWHS